MDRFQAEGSDSFIFLLSTRAGGLGITLTAVSNRESNASLKSLSIIESLRCSSCLQTSRSPLRTQTPALPIQEVGP
jgi:hypothetical protein